METASIKDDSSNLGKLKLLKNYKNTDSFALILSFLTVRENICILLEVNKYFLKNITTIYHKDNSVPSCLKEMKSIIKQVEEFKFITNNHCVNLEDNLKKFKEKNNHFTFNRAVYFLSNAIFKELQTLDLQKNNIGLDGVILLIPLLKKNTTLINLNLAYNNISDDGSKFLATALKLNDSLQSLNLECNGISDQGVISLSEPIVFHKKLKKIKFALNIITLEGLKHLASLLEKNSSQIEVIDFHYNNLVIREDYHNEYFRKYKIAF